MRDNTIEAGQRVHDRTHGDGTVYDIWKGWAMVKFDNGDEDRAYNPKGATQHLSAVTPPLSFPPSPASIGGGPMLDETCESVGIFDSPRGGYATEPITRGDCRVDPLVARIERPTRLGVDDAMAYYDLIPSERVDALVDAALRVAAMLSGHLTATDPDDVPVPLPCPSCMVANNELHAALAPFVEVGT